MARWRALSSLVRVCLLSSRPQVRVLLGAPGQFASERPYPPLLLIIRTVIVSRACQFRARLAIPGIVIRRRAEDFAGQFVDPVRDGLPLFASRMEIDEGGSGRAMSHAVYQLPKVGACRGQVWLSRR
jgi:hypothetical protein